MYSHQPIVLGRGKTFLYDGPGSAEVHISTKDAPAYLIYHNGSYFQADASGTIINNTPIDITIYSQGDNDYIYNSPANDSYFGKLFIKDQ